MAGKSTDELLQIWREREADTWAADAIVAATIELQARLGRLPDNAEEDDAEEDVSPDEDADDIYASPSKLMRVAHWARQLSWAFLCFGGVAAFGTLAIAVTSNATTAPNVRYFISAGIFALLPSLQYMLNGLFYFVILQALAEGIYLFLDIEENTRTK
ncbi:MAG: hypothetical protein R2867_30325 [Caldilineaceae bacterium]